MENLHVNAEECLYVGDGGSQELETAEMLGMKAIQAVWYFKEGTQQPVGRKKNFFAGRIAIRNYRLSFIKTISSWLIGGHIFDSYRNFGKMSLLDNVYDTESRMVRKTALQIPGRNIYWKYLEKRDDRAA